MKLKIIITVSNADTGDDLLIETSLGNSADLRATFEEAEARLGKIERSLPTELLRLEDEDGHKDIDDEEDGYEDDDIDPMEESADEQMRHREEPVMAE